MLDSVNLQPLMSFGVIYSRYFSLLGLVSHVRFHEALTFNVSFGVIYFVFIVDLVSHVRFYDAYDL